MKLLVGGNLRDDPQRQRQCLTELKRFLQDHTESPSKLDALMPQVEVTGCPLR